MADEEKAEETQPEEQEASKKPKGPAVLIGSIFCVSALGAGAAFIALPGKEPVRRFEGPFHHSLFEEKFNANLRDNEQRRYLQTLATLPELRLGQTPPPPPAPTPPTWARKRPLMDPVSMNWISIP